MSEASPRVSIARKPPLQPVEVVLDLDALIRIEEVTGATINQVCAELQACLGIGDAGSRPLGLKLGFVTKFVAACLQIEPKEVGTTFGLRGVKPIFAQLWPPFVQAIEFLNSKEDEASPPPDAGSSASASGPASTSV